MKGSVIRAKHIGKDIATVLRHVVGGEIKEYTEMMDDSRDIAFKRMIKDAEALDADAIVGVRFTTSMVWQVHPRYWSTEPLLNWRGDR